MKPVLLSFGKLHVYAYGMMIAIGIIAAIYYMEKRAPKYGMDSDSAFSMALCAAISGIVGAKVLYLITVLPQLLADPSAITMYLSSGFVVFGGIIGGILSCMLYARHKKWNFIKYFDLYAFHRHGSGIWKDRLLYGRLLLRKADRFMLLGDLSCRPLLTGSCRHLSDTHTAHIKLP